MWIKWWYQKPSIRHSHIFAHFMERMSMISVHFFCFGRCCIDDMYLPLCASLFKTWKRRFACGSWCVLECMCVQIRAYIYFAVPSPLWLCPLRPQSVSPCFHKGPQNDFLTALQISSQVLIPTLTNWSQFVIANINLVTCNIQWARQGEATGKGQCYFHFWPLIEASLC